MEKMDVPKDPAVKMKREDLELAYDAVRVANKSVCHCVLSVGSCCVQELTLIQADLCRFLERQLRQQHHGWEEELNALRAQLSQAVTCSSSAAQAQVR